MDDVKKTKKQLIEELHELRQSVAELKGFEEEIKQTRVSQEKFTKAFLQNSIPVGITTLEEGRFVDVSNAFLRLMGRNRNEVIGHTSLEIGFISAEQRTSFFNELTKKGRVENLEMEVKTKDGELRYGLFNAVLLSIVNEKYLLTVMMDITERKRAEEALHRSETKFRTLYDSTSDAVMLLDERGFFDCNQATLAIFGCATREEFCRKHPADLSPPLQPCGTNSRVLACRMITTAMEKGSSHFEWMHKKKDTGKTFPADVLLTAMELDGKPVIQAVVRDIKERKRAEEYIAQSERKFATAFLKNSIPAAITTIKEGRYLEVSDAFLELMGMERSEVIGNTSTGIGFITPEQRTIVLNEFKQKGSVVNLELQIHTKGEERRYGLFNSVKISVSDEDYLMTVVTDITERKRLEEELKVSEKKYRDIFEYVPIGLYQVSAKGRFINANAHAARIVGYDSPEDLIQSIDNVGTQIYCDPKEREEAFRLLKEKEYVEDFEAECRHKDGYPVWVSFNVRLVRDEEGNILYYEGSSKDITDRKQAEDDLARYREGLEQLVKGRTQELENKTKNLEEFNVALKVLLQHKEDDKKELEDRFVMNVKNLIIPFAEKMKSTHLDERQLAYLSIMETHLNAITSPMVKKMYQFNFTPVEVEVASLLKEGRITKEIAKILGIAASSIDTHRYNIRKKLGINKKNVNLRSHLQALDY